MDLKMGEDHESHGAPANAPDEDRDTRADQDTPRSAAPAGHTASGSGQATPPAAAPATEDSAETAPPPPPRT